MTALVERVTEISDLMKTVKTDWVAEQHENTDILIFVHLFRGDTMVAALQCPLDRDVALNACHLAAVGMAPDLLVVTFESWHSNREKSPITGEDWVPGEMAYVGQTYPEAKKEHWVNECLTTHGFDRFSEYALISTPYLIEGTEVTFEEAEVYDSHDADFKGAGYMHDVLAQVMQMPTVFDQIAEDEGPQATVIGILSDLMSETARWFHLDCAALKAMADKKLIVSAVLIAQDDPERQEMIANRFGDPD